MSEETETKSEVENITKNNEGTGSAQLQMGDLLMRKCGSKVVELGIPPTLEKRNDVAKKEGDEEIPTPNTTIGGYTRFFSPLESCYFWKKEGGFDIIKEGERLGQWECFFEASAQRYFYVNIVTHEVSYKHPEEVVKLGSLKHKGADAAKWVLLKEVFNKDENGENKESKINIDDDDDDFGGGVDQSIIGELRSKKRRIYGSMWKIAHEDRVENVRLTVEESDEEIDYSRDCIRNGRCMVPFNPTDHNRLYWDLFIIIPVLIYLCVALPFTMCFAYKPRGAHAFFETCLDLIFCFDIIISFLTGILVQQDGDDANSEEYVEYDAGIVARDYITTWFFLDLISALPLNLLIKMKGIEKFQYFKLLKSGKALKALRLVRVLKIAKIVKSVRGLGVNMMDESRVDQLEEIFSNNLARSALMLFKITLQLTFINHLLCCLWVYVGRLGDIQNIDNWLAAEGFVYQQTQRGPLLKKIYITSLYFCCTTMTSVGYGDILPYNTSEKIFCIFAQITGGFVYAMIIASLTAIVTFQESNDRIKHEKMAQVLSYINIRRFPKKLARKIRRHFRELFDAQVAVDETAILNELSSDLRVEVSHYLVAEMMEDVMPFKEMSPLQWSIILPLLRPCIFEAGQVLCTQGDYCIETYIILEGCLHGTCSAKRLIRILSGEHIRDARQTLKGRVVGASLLKRKTIMPQFMPNTANLNKEEEDEEDVKTRCIQAGDTVNVLCMLGIWEMAVETVVATETGDSYLINAEEFLSYFSSHSIFEILRQHTVETMFEMANDPDAPTKYGIPLWPLQEEEVFARDAEYLRRKAAEKEASYGKLSENMKLKMKAQKTKRPRETNDQSARSSTIKTMSSKSVISKLRLKGSNLQSAAQQAEELNKRLKKKAGLLASIQKSSARVLTDTDGPTSLFSPTRYSPFKRSSSSDQQSDEKPSVWDDNSQKASSISKKKVSPLPIPSRSISTP